MSFERIIFTLVIAILIFIVIMAVLRIKNQDVDILRLLKEAAETLTELRTKEDEIERLREKR